MSSDASQARPANRPTPLATLFLRAAAIVALGCVVGLAVNAFHPMGLPVILGEVEGPGIPIWVWRGTRRIDPKGARAVRQAHAALFVDTRDRKDYDERHIPGAINLPYRDFHAAYPGVRDRLPKNARLLIYCYGSHCGLSMRLAKLLLPMGYQDLTVMRGGFVGWVAARYEVTAAKTTPPAAGGARR